MKQGRLFLGLLISSTTVPFITSCGSDERVKDTKPNIVYFLVDDMGIGDISHYGQKSFSTPNIDNLAKEGMSFTNHYTGTSVSGPSRASLMTGKHTGHTSVRGNYPEPQLLSDDEATLGKVLKSAGYKTATIGKWGIGHPIPLDDPEKKGFDFFYGYLNMHHAHNCFPEFVYRNGVKEVLAGNKTRVNPDGSNPWAHRPEGVGVAETDARKSYVPDLMLDEAKKFISENRKQPFFLFYSLNLPHANNEAKPLGCETPSIDEDIASKDWPEVEKGFAQMMRIIDNQVGEIIRQLKASGIDDNTIFMFASDNGPHGEAGHSMEFFDSNSSYRGMKRDMYDGGVRTPFFVRWPNVIKGGTKSDVLSAFWDILPTFCDITGVEVPGNTDGVSLLPILEGEKSVDKIHEYLYFEFYEGGGKQSVVTADGWKYIKLKTMSGNPVTELYNLKNDPEEKVNLRDGYPERVNKYEGYIKESHEPFPLISLCGSKK